MAKLTTIFMILLFTSATLQAFPFFTFSFVPKSKVLTALGTAAAANPITAAVTVGGGGLAVFGLTMMYSSKYQMCAVAINAYNDILKMKDPNMSWEDYYKFPHVKSLKQKLDECQ